MQKLVTIYLDNSAYATETICNHYSRKHGFVEEHLQSYSAEGWRIVSVSGLAGGSTDDSLKTWVAVVLEK